MKCKDCDCFIGNYGFCNLLMIHIAEPLHNLSFWPRIVTKEMLTRWERIKLHIGILKISNEGNIKY